MQDSTEVILHSILYSEFTINFLHFASNSMLGLSLICLHLYYSLKHAHFPKNYPLFLFCSYIITYYYNYSFCFLASWCIDMYIQRNMDLIDILLQLRIVQMSVMYIHRSKIVIKSHPHISLNCFIYHVTVYQWFYYLIYICECPIILKLYYACQCPIIMLAKTVTYDSQNYASTLSLCIIPWIILIVIVKTIQ